MAKKKRIDKYCNIQYNKTEVYLTKLAYKQVQNLPKHINEAFIIWFRSVEFEGIANVRKLSGYHDEPLKGKRRRQRSVRLNRAYRIIYKAKQVENILKIEVLEVTKHDY